MLQCFKLSARDQQQDETRKRNGWVRCQKDGQSEPANPIFTCIPRLWIREREAVPCRSAAHSRALNSHVTWIASPLLTVPGRCRSGWGRGGSHRSGATALGQSRHWTALTGVPCATGTFPLLHRRDNSASSTLLDLALPVAIADSRARQWLFVAMRIGHPDAVPVPAFAGKPSARNRVRMLRWNTAE